MWWEVRSGGGGGEVRGGGGRVWVWGDVGGGIPVLIFITQLHDTDDA